MCGRQPKHVCRLWQHMVVTGDSLDTARCVSLFLSQLHCPDSTTHTSNTNTSGTRHGCSRPCQPHAANVPDAGRPALCAGIALVGARWGESAGGEWLGAEGCTTVEPTCAGRFDADVAGEAPALLPCKATFWPRSCCGCCDGCCIRGWGDFPCRRRCCCCCCCCC